MDDFFHTRREIVEQALCSLLADAGIESLSREFVRKAAIMFGVFEDESSIDDIIYGAKEKLERRQLLRRHPPESAEAVRQEMFAHIAAMRTRYDTVLFWLVIAFLLVLVVAGVFFSR